MGKCRGSYLTYSKHCVEQEWYMSLRRTGKRSHYAFLSKSVIGNMVGKLGHAQLRVKSLSCSSVSYGVRLCSITFLQRNLYKACIVLNLLWIYFLQQRCCSQPTQGGRRLQLKEICTVK